jgi:pSer/pThr/pTyr-binding forkhead associated (FHA) protein
MILFWFKHRGTIFPIPEGECVLGRSAAQADIVLPGERVSRRHAVLRTVDGSLYIQDLGSRNGTYVNGRRVTKATVLAAGDVVGVGDEVLEVTSRNAARPDAKRLDTVEEDEDEDVATVTERNAIGLVEEIVARAVELDERAAVANSVREIIDAIADSVETAGRPLGRREAVRLAAASRVVAGWLPDGSLDGWCRNIARRLDG